MSLNAYLCLNEVLTFYVFRFFPLSKTLKLLMFTFTCYYIPHKTEKKICFLFDKKLNNTYAQLNGNNFWGYKKRSTY